MAATDFGMNQSWCNLRRVVGPSETFEVVRDLLSEQVEVDGHGSEIWTHWFPLVIQDALLSFKDLGYF